MRPQNCASNTLRFHASFSQMMERMQHLHTTLAYFRAKLDNVLGLTTSPLCNFCLEFFIVSFVCWKHCALSELTSECMFFFSIIRLEVSFSNVNDVSLALIRPPKKRLVSAIEALF